MVSRFPFPLEKGDKLRSYYQIKELAKTSTIHLISLSDKAVHPDHRKELEKYCASVTIHQLSRMSILWNTFRAFFGKKPLQVGYFYNYKVFQAIQAKLIEIQPTHIISQLIRTAEYTKNYHSCPKTLDYMDALSKIVSICGNLEITNNPLLANLVGLKNLTTIGGNFAIRSNSLLKNLKGLENIRFLSALSIEDNDALENLNELKFEPNLDYLGFYNNPNLINLDAFKNLVTIGYLYIWDELGTFDSLDAFSNVKSFDILEMDLCLNLTSLKGLDNVESIGVLVINEGSIVDLRGMPNLKHINILSLWINYQLVNLSGLENLVTLKSIVLKYNPLLSSIDALSNVTIPDYNPEEDEELPKIEIANNPLLAECAINSICEKISDPDFSIIFSENSVGCESVEVVTNACAKLGVSDMSVNSVKMYPNLTTSIVKISGAEFSQVKIFDMMGKKVLDVTIEANSFNVEKLFSGRYIVQLIGLNGEVVMQDLIVK